MHALIVDETGGRHGVRDIGLLQAACARPFTTVGGEQMFLTVFLKAAVYLESFARYHVFTDGNKRTALLVASRYLAVHGYQLRAGQKAIVKFVVDVVEKKILIEKIALWLEEHSERE